ncbi:MAG: general secretion pathway protein GspK [Myxococcales bacterium]|nr:general secretion pathway protein GspK [Myxococcales bacterium]
MAKKVTRKRRALKRARAKGAPLQRGVALIMVLAAMSLLYVMAEQTRDEVEVYSLAASVERDQLIAEAQARSGVNLARVLLHSEPTLRRAITPILTPLMAMMGRGFSAPPQIPIWEQSDILLGAFRSRDGGALLENLAHVDLGGAKNLGGLTGLAPLVIIDEDSKINVNGANRSSVAQILLGRQIAGLIANPALNPFFEQRDADTQFTDRPTLISNVVDYIDFDETAFDAQSLLATTARASAAGPEDSFYQRLRPPYRRRNAPLDSVDELRMVRGFSDDDLWHSIVDPDPGNPRRRTITVWGQGTVNVNTANAQTLLAMICAYAPDAPQCIDPSQASAFITTITMVQGLTLSMGIPLFSSPGNFVATVQGRPPLGPMLTQLGMQPFQVRDASALERSVATESKVFSVYSEAQVGAAHVRVHAVVDMRAQPMLPSTFMRASGMTVAPTQEGALSVVPREGGTLIYWRED